MKKIILILSFAVVAGMANAFAGTDPKVSPGVQHSFKKEFPNAGFVTWGKDQDYFRASFILNYYKVEAWFSEEGVFLGSARNLLYKQLPLAVMRGVEKKFPSARVTEILEITNAEGTTYRMIATGTKKKIILNATPDGFVRMTGKIRK